MTELLFPFHCVCLFRLWHCAESNACSHSGPNWLLSPGSAEPRSTAGVGPKLLLALLASDWLLLLRWFFLFFLGRNKQQILTCM